MALPALIKVVAKINQVVTRPTDWLTRSMPREIPNKNVMAFSKNLARL
jgi:hypothetical protein